MTDFVIIKVWFDSKCGWYSPGKWFISLGSNVFDPITRLGLLRRQPSRLLVHMAAFDWHRPEGCCFSYQVSRSPQLVVLYFTLLILVSPSYVIRRVKGKCDTTSSGKVRQGGRSGEQTIGGKWRTIGRVAGRSGRIIIFEETIAEDRSCWEVGKRGSFNGK